MNEDFTDIEISLKEARHVILGENNDIVSTNSFKAIPDQSMFKEWAGTDTTKLQKIIGRTTIYLGKKENDKVVLLLEEGISFPFEEFIMFQVRLWTMQKPILI